MRRHTWTFALIGLAMAQAARSADLVALSPSTWDRYAPAGKEADAIYGDFALSNGRILAVIAQPKPTRHANMTVRSVGGCLIDLTTAHHQNDQLSAYYPGAQQREYRFAGISVEAPETYDAADLEHVFVRARKVTLRLVAAPKEATPDVELSYTLEDGKPFVEVTTRFTNRGTKAVDADLLDSIRADRTFEFSPNTPSDLFWANDPHWGQGYGIVPDGHDVAAAPARAALIRYRTNDRKVAVGLAPGESHTLTRRVFPGRSPFDLQLTRCEILGKPATKTSLTVKEATGHPIAGATVAFASQGGVKLAGKTDAHGHVDVTNLGQPGTLNVSAIGNGSREIPIADNPPGSLSVELPKAGAVVAKVTGEQGGPIPCKVQFLGKGGTKSPDFGHETGEHAIKNVYYSQNGQFTRTLEPGSYDVIVSYGPEYDAVFTSIQVERGKETPLDARLVRSVRSDGWISTDFHSHSTPSGDNTSSQLGRVLNLLCEHVEFAPCTEHNRLSTYDPHLKHLGVESLMGTCVGMELTGTPLPLNHQNAFPLVMRPRTQDNGGPTNDLDPETQIERLALWDGNAEKLVQVNHPDIGWMFRDRDGNGVADKGYAGMHGKMDVIEVHPPHGIFQGPRIQWEGRQYPNTIRAWLQLLNQGKRIPGVVNTDAHYNFHGSGWLRNYVKSPTDDPSKIKTLDVVHACEKGNIVMSTGPFMTVELASGTSKAGPGEDLKAPGGMLSLKVNVQCPNWFDVDRVQVFVNGKADEALNFTRKANREMFSNATVKFDRAIPLTLPKDAHIIVAAIGEGSKLGDVMGPEHKADLPVAVSNPIFVDVDGGGFKPNGDTLGGLPTKN